jgi:hypothetical protein
MACRCCNISSRRGVLAHQYTSLTGGDGGRVAQTLVFCSVFIIISLTFYPLCFVHYIVLSSSKYFEMIIKTLQKTKV